MGGCCAIVLILALCSSLSCVLSSIILFVCPTDAREVEEKAHAPSEAEAQAHAGALEVSAYPLPVRAVIYHSRQVLGRAGTSRSSGSLGAACCSRPLVRYHTLAGPSVCVAAAGWRSGRGKPVG